MPNLTPTNMVYINPIEILELKGVDVNEIDSSRIKKQKRILFADIELSDDGYLTYNGQNITKSDCERAIEELEDRNKLEFYSHLASNYELNAFLANGNHKLLNQLKQESIYKLPEFVAFVSPFFSTKIDSILVKSFQNNDLELFTAALRADYLIAENDLNNAYRSLSNEIDSRISLTDKLTKEIKDEISDYDEGNIQDIITIVEQNFTRDFLNELPSYFQSQINKIAASINFLQIQIWNEFSNTTVALKLLEYLLDLNIESVLKPTFQKNYNIVKKKHEERIAQEKNAPLIKKWAKILIALQNKVEEVENDTIKAASALSFIKTLFDSDILNSLPNFANEIRTQIAYSIRSISIASWNKQNDINSALALIRYALNIHVNDDVKVKFQQDEIELKILEEKYRGILVCFFCDKNPPENGCELDTTIYMETNRTYFPSRVQYSYSKVSIPRCSNCKEIHSMGISNYYFAFFGLLILGVIIGAATEGEHYIIGGIIGAAVGWIVGNAVEGNQLKKQGIKDASESTLSQHPILFERIKSGWTFSQPSA